MCSKKNPTSKIAAVAIIGLVLSLGMLVNPQTSLAFQTSYYSCPPWPYSNCYGVYVWSGNVHGAYTTINVKRIVANQARPDPRDPNGNYFIDHINNTIWTTYDGDTWLEAGYLSQGGALFYYYEIEVAGTPILGYKIIDYVPSGDVNNSTVVGMVQNTPNWSFSMCPINSWIIGFASANFNRNNLCFPYTYPMNYTVIGQEVAGGALTAPTAFFTQNKYVDPNLNSLEHQFLRASDASRYSPPYANWPIYPAPGNQGGTMQTYCC